MDIEATVIAHLADALKVPVYADPPKTYPDRFITVERTGGGSEFGVDRPSIAVQSWATSRYEASALAREVDSAMGLIESIENVMSCERTGLYNFPDPDSQRQRYQGTYDLITE